MCSFACLASGRRIILHFKLCTRKSQKYSSNYNVWVQIKLFNILFPNIESKKNSSIVLVPGPSRTPNSKAASSRNRNFLKWSTESRYKCHWGRKGNCADSSPSVAVWSVYVAGRAMMLIKYTCTDSDFEMTHFVMILSLGDGGRWIIPFVMILFPLSLILIYPNNFCILCP